jgi:trans-aconitate methyltransferase
VSTTRKSHWDRVYEDRVFTDVSWYQAQPSESLDLIEAAATHRDAPIIDIGGGASTLVDHLLDRGYRDLTVLDVSEQAFTQARARLGEAAGQVSWIATDVTMFRPERTYDLWHDRAVLHFLIDAEDRRRYLAALRRALAPGGHLVLATFGPEGPQKCSGLEVRRYSMDTMAELLGADFELCSEQFQYHETPSGGSQQFLFTRWRRLAR